MTALADRLRTAAAAPRLADFVRYNRLGLVFWRTPRFDDLVGIDPGYPLTWVTRQIYPSTKWWFRLWSDRGWSGLSKIHPTREDAIRAGLLALAERLEAKA